MRFPLPQTLQARLILSHLLVALVGIVLISLFAGSSLFNTARQQVEHYYEDLAFAASNELEQPLSELQSGQGSPERIEAAIGYLFANEPDVRYTVYLPSGEPLLSTDDPPPPQLTPDIAPEVWTAMQNDIGEGENIRKNSQGVQIHYLAVRISHENRIYGVLRLEIPLAPAMASARRSLSLLLIIDLVVLLGVVIVGYLLASSLAGPIEGLTQTAEQLSHGDLGARVETPPSPQELHKLAEAFNAMASRLQTHVNELRSFVANASHELRTPLTSVKLRVEALRNGALDDPVVTDRFLAEIESEVDRLSNMVNDMLDLSRIEAGMASSQRSPLDLSTIVGEVCDTFHARAERAGVALECDIQSDLQPVMGNEDQLRRMLYNLVDNAIKYTSNGGRVNILLRRGEAAQTIRLMVKDTGFGIAASHLPHVFERFYRVEATRPRYGPPQGSGLGLPIAKSIVETHGGKIGVISEVGEGSTFWVELPVIS